MSNGMLKQTLSKGATILMAHGINERELYATKSYQFYTLLCYVLTKCECHPKTNVKPKSCY